MVERVAYMFHIIYNIAHMTEKWKNISGWSEKYQISSAGRIRSINYKRTGQARILNGFTKVNGYQTISFREGGAGSKQRRFMVHRLVAESFIPNPDNKKYVNHKDGNRENNDVSNLEWCTRSENERHKIYTLGHTSGSCIPPKQVICVETGEIFPSVTAAARSIGVCQESVSSALRGKSKTSGGFHWKYL